MKCEEKKNEEKYNIILFLLGVRLETYALGMSFLRVM